MKRTLFAVGLLALAPAMPASAACVCNTAALDAIMTTTVLPELYQIRPTLNRLLGSQFASQGNVAGQLMRIQNEAARQRAAIADQTTKMVALSDFEVKEERKSIVLQTLSDNDAHAAIATVGSIPPGACTSAQVAQRVGRGTYTQAIAGQVMGVTGRQDFNRVKNPAHETTRVLAMSDAERVPEFIGSDAGTLNSDQAQQFMNAVTMLMPVPPTTPAALPDRLKARDTAKAYEAQYRKAESAQIFLNKPFVREAALMYPSIEYTPEMGAIWDQIVSGSSANGITETAGDGASQFPSHWNSLQPTTIDNGSTSSQSQNPTTYISERDFMRLEVFKRYANPHYQSDPRYGLAALSTDEALLKELIAVTNLQNRMIYEIMNSDLHSKQYLALIAAGPINERYSEELLKLETRLAAD